MPFQSPPPPPPQEVTETIVSAPRSSQPLTSPGISHQVITAAELEATGQRSLPSALAKTSGLFVQETNLGGGAPILRGLIGNQVLIVVDGVRLNDSTTRGGPNQSLNSIDMATVERVEVIRGPTSVLYGSDALGGTILVWTKNRAAAKREPGGLRDGLRVDLDAQYVGAVEGATESLGLSDAWRNDGLVGIGSFHEWNELQSAEGQVDNTGYHGLAWFGSWEHAFSRQRYLRLSASQTRDFDVPRSDRMNVGYGQTVPSDSEHFFTLEDRQRYVLAYTDEVKNFADTMQVRLSLREYDEQRQIRRYNTTTRSLEEDKTTTVGLGADWRKAVGGSQIFTWGFDVDYDDVDSTKDNLNINTGVITPSTGNFAPDSKYLASGVFVQDEIFAFDPVDVTAGLRYSRFDFSFDDFTTGADTDGDFSALTGSLQAASDVAKGTRLSATLAQGFRAPNLSELARNATFAAGTELANPDLEPEDSFYQELAIDFTRAAWNLSFGVYHNAISDVVGRVLQSDPTPGIPGDEVYLRDNVGDLKYYGAELRGRHALGAADSPYSVGAYIEYTWGEQDDNFSGVNPASKVPPLHGNVSLAFDAPAEWKHLSNAELSAWWADSQERLSPSDLSDPRIDPTGTDGWVSVDLDFRGPLGAKRLGASWNLGFHNIFDEAYRVHGSGIDAPGFNVVAGLHLSL